MKELALWRAAGIDPAGASGTWYRETGSGMGATLNLAVGMGAYALTDRGTWIAFRNKGDFRVLVEGDDAALQPLWRDPGQPGAAPAREGRRRPGLHRLADRRRGAGGDRRVPAGGQAAVLSERGGGWGELRLGDR